MPENSSGKGIYGEKAYQLESGGYAYFDANENSTINSGKAYVSFSERVRRSKDSVPVSSISVTDSDASLPSDGHADDYIFQIKNDGGNFDLYVANTKVADLTDNGSFDTNNMSYILDVEAIIDIDNDKLNLKATHNGVSKDFTVSIPDTVSV